MVAKTKIEFSLVLPCYNEGPTFEDNVSRITGELKGLKSWEIIFVEDKSDDDTKASITKLLKQIKNSRAIYHLKNEGRGKSVRDGILAAKGEVCGFIDVDCEISPTYIPIFIEEIKKGADMAIATRYYESKPHAIVRLISSKVYSMAVSALLKAPFADTEAGFKFFRRRSILPVLGKTYDNGWFWDTEICMMAHFAGLKIVQVPVLFIRREDKKSTVKLIPDSLRYFRMLLKFRIEHRTQLHRSNG